MADENDDPVVAPAAPPTDTNTDPVVAAPETAQSAGAMSIFGSAARETLSAFGRGFMHGWGAEELGIPVQDYATLQKIGLIRTPEQFEKKQFMPFTAMTELALETAVRTGQVATRGLMGVYRGAQEVGVTAGLHRDIVSVPDAFMGSPKPTGMFSVPRLKKPTVTVDLPRAKDLEVIGDPRHPITEGTPADAARNSGPTGIVAYHGSPYSFDAFSMEKIGTGEGAQSYGHGLYFAEHPEVSKSYAQMGEKWAVNGREYNVENPIHRAAALMEEYHGKREFAIKEARRMRDHDPTDYNTTLLNLLENYDKEVPKLEKIKDGELYQVRINADKSHFLDWDKPLSEQSPEVQAGIKKLGIEQSFSGEEMYRELKEMVASNKKLPPDENGIYRFDDGRERASEMLREAGIPGIKYLDQGSRGTNAAKDALTAQLRKAEALGDKGQIAELQQLLKEHEPTHNYVLFDDSLVDITHKNGVPVEEPPRSAPLTTKGDVVKSEPTGNPWRDRFDEWVGRLKTTDDFKDLISKAADAAGEFQLARRGEVPVAHIAGVADAAGVNPASINAAKLGRLMKRDEEIILTKQALFKLNDDVHAAMREVSANPDDPATLIKLTEAMIRRDTGLEGALEQAVGLRAEWGRAGNALKTLLEEVKDGSQLGDFLRKHKNDKMTLDDLRRLADEGAKLDPRTQLPNFLTNTRKPTFWDKFLWYWTNSLISGLHTHGKYVIANAAYAGWESGVVTPVAGMIGKVRELFTEGEIERAYVGEAAARTWGYVAGTPDAIKAAYMAGKTGAMTQLPHEITTNSPINIFTGQKPVGTIPGRIFGVPAHMASSIHTFFRFLGYTAELEAHAYRATVKDGLSPLTDQFWKRYSDHRAFPEDAWMDKAIENGNKLTFITELGEKGKAFQNFTAKSPPAKLLVPFAHIPINIMKATYENTPFGLLDKDIRATLRGERGAVERDMQLARTIAGSAVSAYVVNLALNDRITGAGPSDKNERASWMLTHQPYSVRIGDTWYSFQRFGPIGNLIGLAANLAEVGPHIHEEEYAKGAWGVTHSAAHLLMEETGFQGIYLFVKALESEKRGASYVSNFMASLLPYSSLFGQTASSMDPYMRETKTFLDGLKFKIPVARETLFPKRDWTGQPVANNAEGLLTVIKNREVNEDPVDIEMQTLKLRVAPPQDRIGGVKLTRELYDEFQTTAGAMTRQALEHLVQTPGWFDLPIYTREKTFQSTIETTRRIAGSIMQMKHPELIQQGIEDKVNHIKGNKPTPIKSQRGLEERLRNNVAHPEPVE